MRPEDGQVAWENEGQRGEEAMQRFFAAVERAVREAEAEGLYMPAVVTALEITVDELKDRYPSDLY